MKHPWHIDRKLAFRDHAWEDRRLRDPRRRGSFARTWCRWCNTRLTRRVLRDVERLYGIKIETDG